jgi:hypothetical protein
LGEPAPAANGRSDGAAEAPGTDGDAPPRVAGAEAARSAWSAAARSAASGDPAPAASGGAEAPAGIPGKDGDAPPDAAGAGTARSAWFAAARSAASGEPAPAARGGAEAPADVPGTGGDAPPAGDELAGVLGAGEVLLGALAAGPDGLSRGLGVLACGLGVLTRGVGLLARGLGAGVAFPAWFAAARSAASGEPAGVGEEEAAAPLDADEDEPAAPLDAGEDEDEPAGLLDAGDVLDLLGRGLGSGVLACGLGAAVARWAWRAAAPSAPDGPLELDGGVELADGVELEDGVGLEDGLELGWVGLAVGLWPPAPGAGVWPAGAAEPVPVAARVACSAWLAPACSAALAGPPAVPGVTILMPAPWASRGIRRIQPGLINAAMVRLAPSGCLRPLFISKISW